MSDEIWWACTIEAVLADDRELDDDEVDRLLGLDGAAASLPPGRCTVTFSVLAGDPPGAVTTAYRQWRDAAPPDATAELVELKTAERQESELDS